MSKSVEKSCCVVCEVNGWVGELLKGEKLKHFTANISGTSEKGDGYIGDITFVEVTAQKEEKYHIVLKHGKTSGELRQKAPVRLAFEREIFVYSKVKPIFEKFLEQKGGSNKMDVMPKCYGTLLLESQEVLALQNVKTIGYDLHDRKTPMDMKHINLTLDVYGRWHAISLAYHDQNPQEFKSLTSNLSDIWLEFAKAPIAGMMANVSEVFTKILREHKEMELAEKFQRKYPNLFQAWRGLASENFEGKSEAVLTHGDCWNNNFMFKYEAIVGTIPSSNQKR